MTFAPDPLAAPEEPRDTDHLRTLVVLHYVWAAMKVLTSFCCGGYAIFNGFLIPRLMEDVAKTQPPGSPPMPSGMFRTIGSFYLVAGAILFLVELTLAALALVTARRMTARRSRAFCIGASAAQCLSIPLGTILGIFTILVLQRPTVARRFDGPPA